MKKILSLLVASVLVLAACDNKSEEKLENGKPVVKIGVSLPLSGSLAPIGNAIKQALIMAQKEVPAHSKYNYEIIFDDDTYELSKIAKNTNRQISIEKVDAILSLFDGAAAVISPIAERAKIPNIGCTWGADFFKNYSFSFNHWSRPETQAEAFIELLRQKQSKSFAVVTINNASSQELLKHIEKEAKENGIKITSVNAVNRETKDFRIIIEKIKQQHPDVIMLQMLDPELGIFTKQAYESGLGLPFAAIDQFQTAQNKKLLEGAEFVLSIDGSKEFKDRLAKESDLPAYPCVANLYDAFKILVNIYETSAERPSGEQIKNKLYETKDYPSSLGVKLSVDKDGIIDSPLIKAAIQNGEVVLK